MFSSSAIVRRVTGDRHSPLLDQRHDSKPGGTPDGGQPTTPVHLGGQAAAVVFVQLSGEAELAAEGRSEPQLAPRNAQLVDALAGLGLDRKLVRR